MNQKKSRDIQSPNNNTLENQTTVKLYAQMEEQPKTIEKAFDQYLSENLVEKENDLLHSKAALKPQKMQK